MSFKILGINHLGIAAKDPQKAREFFHKLLALPFVGEETVAEQKTHTIMFEAAHRGGETSSRIELLEPVEGADGPISKFLASRGGGIHHVALQVDHIDAALEALTKLGVELIDKTPRMGAHKTRVAFIHPRATGGILVELVEESH